MNIGGHGLRDHLRLLAPLFGLIAAVWALRMVLDFARVPSAVVRISSVTVAVAVSSLVAVVLIHIKRFGGYANVVAVAFLLELWAHSLISSAIVFFALTGIRTVYSQVRYSGGLTPWHHMAGHLTFALAGQTLFGSAMGCLLLLLLRVLVPATKLEKGA